MKHDLDSIIKASKLIHGDKYDYSNVVFSSVDTKVTIVCPIHGEFTQTPYHHINRKQGCAKCGQRSAAQSKYKTLEEFIQKARKVHGDKYDYSKTVYKTAKAKVTITCPIHGDFEQLVSGHLSGYGCKKCTSYGKGRVDLTKPCTLYYLHLPELGLYKLGITTRDLTERYRTKFDQEQFTILFSIKCDTGDIAYTYEQSMFKQFDSCKYQGPKVLHSGNTEIFTLDIFNGIYPTYQIIKDYYASSTRP